MEDFDDDQSPDDMPPIRLPSRHLVKHKRNISDGLTEENERALQDVVQGFRATWKLIAWLGRALIQGTIVAISGLIAVWIVHHIWPDHLP